MVKNSTKSIKIVKSYIKELKKTLEIKKVIIFGSAARGEMRRDSDIDIIVLSPDFKTMGFVERAAFLNRNRRGLSREVPMDILGYTPKEFDKLTKESTILFEAKEEGIIL